MAHNETGEDDLTMAHVRPARPRLLPGPLRTCDAPPSLGDPDRERRPDVRGAPRGLSGPPVQAIRRGAPRHPCRFRVHTAVVPVGRLVRHPRCPLCGETLAYRIEADRARYLHADDPRFTFTIVP